MWLAIETSTDRASVAVGREPANATERELTGARRHAGGLLPMIAALLREGGATLDDVTALALSDGPGSFTGLRVGAAVAKALVQARDLPLWIAPSLMVRAAGVARPGQVVVAVADALRGDLYAAAYRFEADGVHTLAAPAVVRPTALAGAAIHPDLVVGDAPPDAAAQLERWSGAAMIRPPDGAPHARVLLGLVHRPGGARRLEAAQGWEPVYGRPAEAQARWE